MRRSAGAGGGTMRDRARHLLRARRSDEIFEQNKAAAVARNISVMRVSLFSAVLVFGIALVLTFFLENQENMRLFYVIIIAICIGLLLTLRYAGVRLGIAFSYIAYGILITYSTLTSAFVSSDYICVTVLAFLFQFPVLYLDKGWRICLATLLSAAAYLLIVCPRKAPFLVSDEIINVISFSVIGGVIGAFTRRAQLENLDMKRTLESYAYTDQLTGLPNRRQFFELLAEAEAPDCAEPILAFAMMDIDTFKAYNDQYGHQSGDECLRLLGACLAAYAQESGVGFYRYGGEEFVGVNRRLTLEAFTAVCERLRQSVADMRIQNVDGSVSGVTVSIGVAAAEGPSHTKYEELLVCADKALYAAKNRGRNRVTLYEAASQAQETPGGAGSSFRQRK